MKDRTRCFRTQSRVNSEGTELQTILYLRGGNYIHLEKKLLVSSSSRSQCTIVIICLSTNIFLGIFLLYFLLYEDWQTTDIAWISFLQNGPRSVSGKTETHWDRKPELYFLFIQLGNKHVNNKTHCHIYMYTIHSLHFFIQADGL